MKLLLLLLFVSTMFAATAQGGRKEPIGKRGDVVVAQGDLTAAGDIYPAIKDTTGAAPAQLGALRIRSADGYMYQYLSTAGRKWFPLIPVVGLDTLRFGRGIYYTAGIVGARIASSSDSGVLTPAQYNSFVTDTLKRVVSFTITGTTTKIVTITFNDGTQLTQSFSDIGGTSSVASVGSGNLSGLFTTNNSGTSTNPVISFTPVQLPPLSVWGTTGNTEAPSAINLSADYIKSGVFAPGRLPMASSTSTGTLQAADYNRLFTRLSATNPASSIAFDMNAGGQLGVTFTSTGGRTLGFTNLRIGDQPKVAFTNSSGAAITLTLPTGSFLQGTGAVTTVTIPANRSILQLQDFDGNNFWFSLTTY